MPGSPIQPLPEPFFVTESGSPELLTRIRSEDVKMLYPVRFSIEEARHVLSVRRAPLIERTPLGAAYWRLQPETCEKLELGRTHETLNGVIHGRLSVAPMIVVGAQHGSKGAYCVHPQNRGMP
jgi:hypothetical protein